MLEWGKSLLDRDARVVYSLALHRFVRPELETGRSLRYVTDCTGGKQLAIKRIPLISSVSFMRGQLLPPDEKHSRPGVRLFLDRHGANLWLQTCKLYPGRHVAVIVDGFYYFSLRIPTQVDNPMVLDIRGSWSSQEAEHIAERVEKNYKILNGKEFRFPW